MAEADVAVGTSSSSFMKANVIDGKAVADQIRKEVAERVVELKSTFGQAPGLAVVIVGERGDSQTYVRMKKKACEEVGIVSFGASLPETATQDEVLKVVQDFNDDPRVHGILVQLPLPKHIKERVILEAISLEKDVDGFHPLNVGKVSMKGHTPLFVPCTPLGCIELLDRCNIPIKGANAVVVGRSNIVGMPVAMLLLRRNATITVCHSGTKDMEALVKQADIVIAACGQAALVKGSWIKPGAAVIDVGTNPIPDATKKSGFRLVGDVEFSEAVKVAGAITPVPGGVGPMTITMLLSNTVQSARRAFQRQDLQTEQLKRQKSLVPKSHSAARINCLRAAFDKMKAGVSPAVVAAVVLGASVASLVLGEGIRRIMKRARRGRGGVSVTGRGSRETRKWRPQTAQHSSSSAPYERRDY